MNHKRLKTTVTLLIGCLALPAQALAGSADVIRDCSRDGVLNGSYSQGELQRALKKLPSDLDEYSDCRSLIREAALAKAGGDKGVDPSAAASKVDANAPASEAEQRKVAKAAKAATAVDIGGEQITPGDPGFLAASFDNDVPALLIAIMALFGAAALAAGAFAAERRWPGQVQAIGGTAAKPFKAVGRRIKGGASRFRR